jgi:hypothetical protein
VVAACGSADLMGLFSQGLWAPDDLSVRRLVVPSHADVRTRHTLGPMHPNGRAPARPASDRPSAPDASTDYPRRRRMLSTPASALLAAASTRDVAARASAPHMPEVVMGFLMMLALVELTRAKRGGMVVP